MYPRRDNEYSVTLYGDQGVRGDTNFNHTHRACTKEEVNTPSILPKMYKSTSKPIFIPTTIGHTKK